MMPFVSHRSCGDTPSLYTHCTGTLLAPDTPWPHHVETPSPNNACLHQTGTPLNLVPFCRHHAGSGTPGPTHFPEMFKHVHLGLHYTVTPPPPPRRVQNFSLCSADRRQAVGCYSIQMPSCLQRGLFLTSRTSPLSNSIRTPSFFPSPAG